MDFVDFSRFRFFPGVQTPHLITNAIITAPHYLYLIQIRVRVIADIPHVLLACCRFNYCPLSYGQIRLALRPTKGGHTLATPCATLHMPCRAVGLCRKKNDGSIS